MSASKLRGPSVSPPLSVLTAVRKTNCKPVMTGPFGRYLLSHQLDLTCGREKSYFNVGVLELMPIPTLLALQK